MQRRWFPTVETLPYSVQRIYWQPRSVSIEANQGEKS
jgi:hypothetical protein